jgi:hypothetical protein
MIPVIVARVNGVDTILTGVTGVDPEKLYYAIDIGGGHIDGEYTISGVNEGDFLFTKSGTFTERVEIIEYQQDATGVELAYQGRPEDEDGEHLVYELADEYPHRRDPVAGGEVVDLDSFQPPTSEYKVVNVRAETGYYDHTGAHFKLHAVDTKFGYRLLTEARPSGKKHDPTLTGVAYKGTFRDVSTYTEALKAVYGVDRSLYGTIFTGAYSLFHVGLVQGVLVADPDKFFAPHHADNLVAWWPFNEHPEDELEVLDRSRFSGHMALTTVPPASRAWDLERGWHMDNTTGSFVSEINRGITDKFTVSMWIKPGLATGSGEAEVFHGLGCTVTVSNYDTDGFAYVTVRFTSRASLEFPFQYAMTPGQFYQVVLQRDGNNIAATFASASPITAVTFQPFDAPVIADNVITVGRRIQPASRHIGIHDVRVWNSVKSVAEVECIRYHNPTPTIVPYPLAEIRTVAKNDRLGLRVLDSGFIAIDKLPIHVRSRNYGRVIRYKGDGSYLGDLRQKETGLGHGGERPFAQTLGMLPYDMTGTGKVVVSNGVDGKNPAKERIWVKGEDGKVWEVYLSPSAPVAIATRYPTRERSAAETTDPNLLVAEQPTGIESVIVQSGFRLAITAQGAVTAVASVLADNPGYLLLNEELLADVTDASQQALDGIAELAQAGTMVFDTPGTLTNEDFIYRLEIDSGNVGTLDSEFDGFAVEIEIGGVTYVKRLLKGKSGTNVTGTDILEFKLEQSIGPSWQMTLNWTNSIDVPERGATRYLKIYSYRIYRVRTKLYRLDYESGTFVANEADTTSFSEAGGWIYSMGVNGGNYAVLHEVNPTEVRSKKSRHALANVRSGSSSHRHEDHQVSFDNVSRFQLPDESIDTLTTT